MSRLSAAIRAATLTLAGVLLMGVGAAASPGVVAGQPDPPGSAGWIRLGHLAPQTPTVDVYLAKFGQAENAVIRKAGYGVISGYYTVDPGRYTVSMRPASAAPDTPVALSQVIDVQAGSAYSMLVFETGPQGSLQASVVTDELSAAPATGRMRIVQGAAGQPPVTVSTAGGPVIAQGADYGTTTPYAEVPSGARNLQLTAGSQQITSTVDVAPGTATTVLVTATDGTLKLTAIKDSTEAATAPVGGIQTGGDIAPKSDDSSTPVVVLVAILVVVAALFGTGVMLGMRYRRTS